MFSHVLAVMWTQMEYEMQFSMESILRQAYVLNEILFTLFIKE